MLTIQQLRHEDLRALKRFTDLEIGNGYYSPGELEDVFERSQRNGINCSLVLKNSQNEIVGVRFSYPPNNWDHGKGSGLMPHLWAHGKNETAYFQSLFLAKELQGQGWGGRLSKRALGLLREAGARGVVCHSWKESPHNSSTKYLIKLGFQPVAEHARYWENVNYNCPICGEPPCQCTAIEMYLDLEKDYEHILLA